MPVMLVIIKVQQIKQQKGKAFIQQHFNASDFLISCLLHCAGEDQTDDSKHEKHDCTEPKNDKKQEMKGEQKIDKVKQAAVSAVSAAAVKAKLLAEQEEDQIRQLAAMLIEKQVIPMPSFLLTVCLLLIT